MNLDLITNILYKRLRSFANGERDAIRRPGEWNPIRGPGEQDASPGTVDSHPTGAQTAHARPRQRPVGRAGATRRHRSCTRGGETRHRILAQSARTLDRRYDTDGTSASSGRRRDTNGPRSRTRATREESDDASGQPATAFAYGERNIPHLGRVTQTTGKNTQNRPVSAVAAARTRRDSARFAVSSATRESSSSDVSKLPETDSNRGCGAGHQLVADTQDDSAASSPSVVAPTS